MKKVLSGVLSLIAIIALALTFLPANTAGTIAVPESVTAVKIVAAATPIAVTINGYGMNTPRENGEYIGQVNSIEVNYPKQWKLISVQRVGPKYLATMEVNGSSIVDRYTTFWINPESEDFRNAAKRKIGIAFKQKREPISLCIHEELSIGWIPTEEARLHAMTASPGMLTTERPAPPPNLRVAGAP